MIDLFCIFTTGGLILWSKAFVSFKFDSIINDLIKTILMDEKRNQEYYISQNSTGIVLRWKVLNQAGLIFVIAYQQSYNVLYADKLIDIIVRDFNENQLPQLKHQKNIYFDTPDYNETFMKLLRKWEKYCQDEFENKNKKPSDDQYKRQSTQSPNDSKTMTIDRRNNNNQIKSNDDSKVNNFIPGATNFTLRKSQTRSSNPNSGGQKSSKKKEGRIWDDQPKLINDKIISQFDNSVDKPEDGNKKENIEHFKEKFLGAADPDNLNDNEFDQIDSNKSTSTGGIFSKLSSKLQNYIGNKTLTEEDLQPIMEQLCTLLMEKNVAKEIAESLCESVKKSLLNTKTGSFTTINTTVKNALRETISKILTPKEDLDILKQALASKKRGEPYKIVFIGVNGVGKSTNLAKVGYLLMNNGLKIQIAACDNFRSGAVEQLKTHTRALGAQLFEKGYKDDPAYICKEAIEDAKKNGYDCVLIDTAGRMQDNEPLMKSLAKLIEINQPDAILFVGEALTGNDSVDQLLKFNQALIDNSKKEKPRTIDGIVLTKFDTVDDKVGAALTMVYTTGKPIVYVGTGQKYINLKKLNVNNVLNALFG